MYRLLKAGCKLSRLSNDRVSSNVPLIFMLHPSSNINASPRSENSRRSLARLVSLLASWFFATFKMSMQSCRISSMYGSEGDFFPFPISMMIFSHPTRFWTFFTAPCSLAFLLYFRGIFVMSHTGFFVIVFFPARISLIHNTITQETHSIRVWTAWDMFFNSSFILVLFFFCPIHLNSPPTFRINCP